MATENRVYASEVAIVTSSGSGEVAFISIESKQVIGTVKLGLPFPDRIAATPDGRTAIVSHMEGYISFLDITTMACVKNLELLRGPEGTETTPICNEFGDVAVTPDGITAIVTEANELGQLFFFNMGTMVQSGSTLFLGDDPGAVVIKSDGTKAYLLDEGDIYSVRLPERVNEGILCFQPAGTDEIEDFDLTLDETRSVLIDCDDRIYLIDMSTCSVLDTVTLNEDIYLGTNEIAISPTGTTAIVTNPDYQGITFVSIGATSLNVIETIDVGGGADSVAFTPDGQKAVVTIRDKSLVAIIDVTARKIEATISDNLGLAPTGVVIVEMEQVPSDPKCECDLNLDGKCDMQDWLLFGQDWGRVDCPLCP